MAGESKEHFAEVYRGSQDRIAHWALQHAVLPLMLLCLAYRGLQGKSPCALRCLCLSGGCCGCAICIEAVLCAAALLSVLLAGRAPLGRSTPSWRR